MRNASESYQVRSAHQAGECFITRSVMATKECFT
jgi:hypothetical protein